MSLLGKMKRKWKKELIYNPKRFYWDPAHSAHHKMMSLPFNMLSRFVRAFLPKSKHLLISWLQSPSAVIWEPKKIKSVTASTFPPSYYPGTSCQTLNIAQNEDRMRVRVKTQRWSFISVLSIHTSKRLLVWFSIFRVPVIGQIWK